MPRFAALIGLLIAVPFGHAQAPVRHHTVVSDDYFTLATITQMTLSPGGDNVVYADARWRESSDDRKTDLWVVPAAGGGEPRRLTFDRANDRTPKWRPGLIYFLGNRKRAGENQPPFDGKTQVCASVPTAAACKP